jgi:AcrR family transcriptional regulator
MTAQPGVTLDSPRRDRAREQIVAAATDLLTGGGREAVSTRAVCAAAGVQPPTIYRLFGDKQGLLDAVAAKFLMADLQLMETFEPLEDPVEDLRAGWDGHVSFGLAHPDVYSLLYGDRRTAVSSPAVRAASKIVADKVHTIAAAGRLRIPEDRAADLLQATASGAVMWLNAIPEDRRDPSLLHLAREAVISAIVTDAPVIVAPGATPAAVALRAALSETGALSTAERALMEEWLLRITTT